jgi:hypothetical protein
MIGAVRYRFGMLIVYSALAILVFGFLAANYQEAVKSSDRLTDASEERVKLIKKVDAQEELIKQLDKDIQCLTHQLELSAPSLKNPC